MSAPRERAAPATLGAWQRTSWLALAGAAGAARLRPELTTGPARWAPMAVSLVVLGVPHGAVDHHVADRLAPRPDPAARRRRRGVTAAYAGASLAGVALWQKAPRAAAGAFLAVSAAHWGQGEGWWAREVAGRAPWGTRRGAVAWAAARGALPIFGSALAHPAEAQAVLQALVDRVDPGARVPPLAGAPRAAAGAALGATVALAAVGSVRDHRGAERPGAVVTDLAELAGLALFFAATPATWAVGSYFLAWHAPRHVARLVAARPEQVALLDAGHHGPALLAFHREAAPCTAAALAGTAVLGALGRRGAGGAVMATALAAIAALTYPHVAVVAWMDRRQGVWR